ncbi:pyridoxamine 5'-phosphate oxidase family protein [Alteromonas sp. W364]|uniref:pyridoxamine 5'-phosphate oxidase family protein n=1 Tax=Alteromonas sp. W364 TaxID=3075610 RepID=UPI0028839B8E|nr:pyridoxamine 5'-phosphate oxidase family protein [Alteromonas sp. W364]MDT0628027.1 pyridoxamine 5'-phosphate oxidase family protein [Alteromonas sp. W364]
MTSKLVEQMWGAISDSPYVMVGLNKNAEHPEPMRALLDRNADNAFWFYTSKDNRVAEGGKATITFSSKNHDMFASFSGHLVHESDDDLVDKYWSKQVEAWFEEGKQDPSLVMLRFELDCAEIWSIDPTLRGLIKLATGATIKSGEVGENIKIDY